MRSGSRRTSMGRHLACGVSLSVALVVCGCGGSGLPSVDSADPPVSNGDPARHAYDGPLFVSREEAEHPGAGAAGDVVDCRTWGDGGFRDEAVFASGATADSAEQALENAHSEMTFGGAQERLLVAKRNQDRVLYVLEVDGVAKQAVIVHNGPATEGAGGPGWHVESWAHCDYSELPRWFTDSIGLQIWTDPSGRPVPTTTIQAWTGPEHCDWQSMTFLYLGGELRPPYVRDPLPSLDENLAESYDPHIELPADAVDTGFSRDGTHLWLSSDKQQAFIGTVNEVEAWPRGIEGLNCE
jgi:hypothetical protein